MQDTRKATGSLLMHPVVCLNGTIIHISTEIVYSFLGYGSSRQEDKRMQRKTGNGYIRKIDFVFYNEKQIREAVLDARNKPHMPGQNGSGIGDPTASAAIRNVTPIRKVNVKGELLEWPEDWLRVVDATYAWCDNDRLIVARDRYNGVDYRLTCAKIIIGKSQYFRLLDDARNYAALCAAQLGLIKVC